MPISESKILSTWLAPLNLSLDKLLQQSSAFQAQVLSFLRPLEGQPGAAEERAGLLLLTDTVVEQSQALDHNRKLLQTAFEVYLDLGQVDKAATLFEAIYPQPELAHVTYQANLFNLRLAQNQLGVAQQILQEMQELHPNRLTTYVCQARFYQDQRQFEQAKEAYTKGLALFPDNAQTLVSLAQCAYALHEPEKAMQWLKQYGQIAKVVWRTQAQASTLLQQLGQAAQAAEQKIRYEAEWANLQTRLIREHTEAKLPPHRQASALLPEISEPESELGLDQAVFEVLHDVFGHTAFRAGQEKVIAQVLAGQDTLAVLPTGGGKSLCYQLPALLLSRPVLVLSPLISLMKDQFDKLPPSLKAQTMIINSSLEPGEANRRLREIRRPGSPVRLIYAAPERLRQRAFVETLRQAGLGLLVVDEAHCVTLWGNDFRPDYLFIRRALADWAVPVLAVTATATPEVATEIGKQLNRELQLVRGSVYRPNLAFSVEKVKSGSAMREKHIAALCADLSGSGIVYARSRNKCESLAQYLQEQGLSAQYYHAGLDKTARQTIQEAWTAGRTNILVATVAFGMGIDKSDVRFIIHLNPPTSLENYMQEAGRAGRDGQPSQCLLLYSSNDKGNLTRWLREDQQKLSLDNLRNVYRVVANLIGRPRKRGVVPMTEMLFELRETMAEPDETFLRMGLSLLERAGILERSYDLPVMANLKLATLDARLFEQDDDTEFETLLAKGGLNEDVTNQVNLVELADRLGWEPSELETHLVRWAERGWIKYEPSLREPYLILKPATAETRSSPEKLLEHLQLSADERLDQLESYLKSRTCRQVLLAHHFGEGLSKPCGQCDNCRARPAPRQTVATATTQRVITPEPMTTAKNPTEAILGCLKHHANGLSRSAILRILLGRASAYPAEQKNPYWATLEGKLTEKKLTAQLDSLIEKGLVASAQAQTYSTTYEIYRLNESGLQWLENPTELAAIPENPALVPTATSKTKIVPDETKSLVLGCLKSLGDEARTGRTGLVRLLMGQPTALGTRASNSYKGCLTGKLKQKETEKLIEDMVKVGWIEEQTTAGVMGNTYQALRLSETGYDWLESQHARD